MSNYCIIGSGAAGIAAANAIRQADPQGNIRVLTNDPNLYYSRPGLAYILSGEVPQNNIFPFSSGYFRDQKIQIVNAPVKSINLTEHLVWMDNQKFISYDRLLIATGARARLPDTSGINLTGVVKLDSLDDAQHILKSARKTKTAVVVGGGITALELAEGLASNGVQVHYFLRGDRYWTSVLDEVESRIVEKRLQQDGIQIHYFTNLLQIYGHKGRVAGVQVDEGGRKYDLPCQMVAVAIGIEPRIELAAQSGLNTQRGVLVDSQMRSSSPDVFAAGDVAQTYDPQSGKYIVDSLWGPAVEQGRTAGLNMAGGSYSYTKIFQFNVTRLAGLVTTIIGRLGHENQPEKIDKDISGIMRGDSEVWRQPANAIAAYTYQHENRIRICLNHSTITGALIMGDQRISHPVQYLIQHQVDISPIREELLTKENDLAEIILEFWKANMGKYAAQIA